MYEDIYDVEQNDAFPDCKDALIKAFEEKPFQTLRHLTINTGLPADAIEPVLKAKYEIFTWQFVGVLEVWFLREKPPVGRLYNSGYNSFLDNGVKSPGKMRRKRKSPTAPPASETVPAAAPAAEFTYSTNVSKFSVELVEQFGYEGLTVKEIAERVKVPRSSASFYLYSKIYPFREAYRAGKQRRANAAVI